MGALTDDAQTLKFVHTYGVGLHSDEPDADDTQDSYVPG